MLQIHFLLGLATFLCTCCPAVAQQARSKVSAEQQAQAADLAEAVQRAGELYVDQKYVECAALIASVSSELREFIQEEPAARPMVRPIHSRLVRAQRLLNAQGVEIEVLPAWAKLVRAAEEAMAAAGSDDSTSIEAAAGTDPLEEVSFAKQIAPILLENCNGCHIGGRRASGNLRMDTYNRLLRGGDSGPTILPRQANASLLVQKIKGESGQRMPAGGRPPLTPAEIELLSTWIQQGAVFDGKNSTANIETLSRQAWASEASHQELFESRRQASLELWRRVMPDAEPQTAVGKELFVLGDAPNSEILRIQSQFEQASQRVKKQFSLPSHEPLFKGGLNVFVLRWRYDYGEFGRMAENRELPKEWLGHWIANPVTAYAVVLDTALEEEQADALALQLATGAYLGAFSDVPYWFAEGIARNLVAAKYRRGDPRVAAWRQQLPAALQQVENAESLLENRVAEETAGLVGMGLTSILLERKSRARVAELLELLRAGRSFNDAMTHAFMPPEAFLKSRLGR